MLKFIALFLYSTVHYSTARLGEGKGNASTVEFSSTVCVKKPQVSLEIIIYEIFVHCNHTIVIWQLRYTVISGRK